MNQQLIKNNYLVVPKFISAKQAKELAGQFWEAYEGGGFRLGDQQCFSAPRVYNFLPCVRVLIKKMPVVAKLVGEEIFPTYTYGRIYSRGDTLKRHRDRSACEISLTVNLSQSDGPWPIWIKRPDGKEVSVDLLPGDAMIYFGCDAEHWREKFEGQSHVQAFFHYVLANGNRACTFFDRYIPEAN